MKNIFVAKVILIVFILLRCTLGEDDATHLANILKKGAEQLAKSDTSVLVVNYQPLDGVNHVYSVELVAGGPIWIGKNNKPQSSTTTSHLRFVSVPEGLRVVKTNGETQLVLKKNGRRIEVVEIR